MPPTPGSKRQRKPAPGISREDSDDELGDEDLPWEWIYDDDDRQKRQQEDGTEADDGTTPRKRKRAQQSRSGPKIVGARMGNFECRIGDTVLLKAEGGSSEAWVGIICEFVEDDGEKAAHFLWFSTEREIRNKQKKRNDFLPVRLTLHGLSIIS